MHPSNVALVGVVAPFSWPFIDVVDPERASVLVGDLRVVRGERVPLQVGESVVRSA